jgi:hypothetical protein
MGAVLAIGLLSHVDASAQSKEDLDKARAAFREGLALSAANNCAGALVKFKAVASVKMAPQVAFNIAECEEKIGKLVSALCNYRLALDAAAGDKKAKDVATKAAPRIASIEERVPKFTIKRGQGAEAATVELDGNELGSTQVGVEMPIDPGPHTIIGRVGQRDRHAHDRRHRELDRADRRRGSPRLGSGMGQGHDSIGVEHPDRWRRAGWIYHLGTARYRRLGSIPETESKGKWTSHCLRLEMSSSASAASSR